MTLILNTRNLSLWAWWPQSHESGMGLFWSWNSAADALPCIGRLSPASCLWRSYCPCTTYWLHFKLVVRLLIYRCGYIHRFCGSKFPSFCVPSPTAIRLQAWSSSLTWFLLPNVHRKYVRRASCDYGAKLPICLSICWLANANFSSSACFSVFPPFIQQGW